MPNEFLADFIYRLQVLTIVAAVIIMAVLGIFIVIYSFLLWLRVKNREEKSLNYVLLQVEVPRDNEVKIDAAEQFFSSLASLKKSGWQTKISGQPHLSFEIVATPGDIRFYISAPSKLRDLIEKQVNGSYPGAEIKAVDEYNIFTKDGRVAFAALKLKNTDYNPIKIFRELPVDPLSSITSNLAKMHEGEGAAIQVLIAPTASSWRDEGRVYISETKKQEANPEKAEFKTDQKDLEAIGNKCGKVGFETIIRIVVSAKSEEMARMHLDNMLGAFSQFNGSLNEFSKIKIRFKRFFMLDFIYRLFPVVTIFKKQTSVLTSEELATIFHFPNKTIETPNIRWLNAKRAPAPSEDSRMAYSSQAR